MSEHGDIGWLVLHGSSLDDVFVDFVCLNLAGYFEAIYDVDVQDSLEPVSWEIEQVLGTMLDGRVLIALGREDALALSETLGGAVITTIDQWRRFQRHHVLELVMTAPVDRVADRLETCA